MFVGVAVLVVVAVGVSVGMAVSVGCGVKVCVAGGLVASAISDKVVGSSIAALLQADSNRTIMKIGHKRCFDTNMSISLFNRCEAGITSNQ